MRKKLITVEKLNELIEKSGYTVKSVRMLTYSPTYDIVLCGKYFWQRKVVSLLKKPAIK